MDFDMHGFCTQTSNILGFVGWIVFIVKVAMPILIIVFGILDFGKAVTGGDTKNIQESFKKFGVRVIAGLIIFFIPSIIIWLFKLIAVYRNQADDFQPCQICILQPWKCDFQQSNDADAY